MKATQVLYLIFFIGILVWVVSSTHLLDSAREGFEDLFAAKEVTEPVIPKGLAPTSIKMEAMPNPEALDKLPFGPYAQMASVGSFQYKDPAMFPAELTQMKKINEDIRSFLLFEGGSLQNNSDPTVQLPLTQLRADSRKLQQEISVLDKNPGIDSQLTQQELADIEGSLVFLQKKVRLFETSGVIEGFQNPDQPPVKTIATKDDLVTLQTRIYAAIILLSSSGTTDPVIQARIQGLQKMYTAITDMITKLNNGTMKPSEIPVYQEDINTILPILANPSVNMNRIFNQESGRKLSKIEKKIASLVGEENTTAVFNSLKEKGMFRMSFDLGYNTGLDSAPTMIQSIELNEDGSFDLAPAKNTSDEQMKKLTPANNAKVQPMNMDMPFDSVTAGMDARAEAAVGSKASRFDWEKRVGSICEQAKLRGLDPEDFGCIPKGSTMSPAYSWRGHAKMVCGRLAATMDPGLPGICGCPPSNWKGWTLSV